MVKTPFQILLDTIQDEFKDLASSNILNEDNKESYENFLAYLICRTKIPDELLNIVTRDDIHSINNKAVCHSLLQLINKQEDCSEDQNYKPLNPDKAEKKLQSNKEKLFGTGKTEFPVMVTLDKGMLKDCFLFRELINAGMNIARINCAHDDPSIWEEFVREVRLGSREINKNCLIYMDLAGPKIRLSGFGSKKESIKIGDVLRLFKQEDGWAQGTVPLKYVSAVVNHPKALYNVRLNDSVFIDEGKIGGKVIDLGTSYVDIEITSNYRKKYLLKEGQGINFPDSLVFLNIPAVTKKDREDLHFIAKHADMVGVSFVHQARDLRSVKEMLSVLTKRDIPMIAKIETKDAVYRLPSIIKEGLSLSSFGIMIARGDLAIEIGFEQMAVVQEEILNIAHSAHIPVIWATQILESLTKTGRPTRAEISDVYLGSRAECIMLNKGKYIKDSVLCLERILTLVQEYKERRYDFQKRNNIFFI